MFESTTQIQPSDPPKSPIIAALLSFFLFGGVGHLYIGQSKKGGILIVGTLVLSWVFGLGCLIPILGAIDAYMMTDKLQSQAIGDMQWFWDN